MHSHCLDSKQVSLMSWLWGGSCQAPFSSVFKSSGYDEFCIGYLKEWLKLSHCGFVPSLMYWWPWTEDTSWSIYPVPREEQLPTFRFKGGVRSIWLHPYTKTSFGIGLHQGDASQVGNADPGCLSPCIGLDFQGMWPLSPPSSGERKTNSGRGACTPGCLWWQVGELQGREPGGPEDTSMHKEAG